MRRIVLILVFSVFLLLAVAHSAEPSIRISQPPTITPVHPFTPQEYEIKRSQLSMELAKEMNEQLRTQLEKLDQGGCASDEVLHMHHAKQVKHQSFASNIFPILWLKDQFSNSHEASQSTCQIQSDCDTPSVRDSFSSFSSIRTINIEFLVETDSSFSSVADARVGVAMTELNTAFSNTGFQFTATIIRWGPLADSSGTPIGTWYTSPQCVIGYAQPCYNYMDVINAIYDGTTLRSTFKKPNTMVMLVHDNQPTTPGGSSIYNGWAHFIWGSDHGIVVVIPAVVQTGYTTIAHEIGHSLGLWHTHHGITEMQRTSSGTQVCLNPVNPCYEFTASDNTGDFCSDTSPFPNTNSVFLSTCRAPTIQEISDPCMPSRTAWGNDGAVNFMSYVPRTCRTVFTTQQKNRMRCYVAKYGYPADPSTASSLHYFAIVSLAVLLLAL